MNKKIKLTYNAINCLIEITFDLKDMNTKNTLNSAIMELQLYLNDILKNEYNNDVIKMYDKKMGAWK